MGPMDHATEDGSAEFEEQLLPDGRDMGLKITLVGGKFPSTAPFSPPGCVSRHVRAGGTYDRQGRLRCLFDTAVFVESEPSGGLSATEEDGYYSMLSEHSDDTCSSFYDTDEESERHVTETQAPEVTVESEVPLNEDATIDNQAKIDDAPNFAGTATDYERDFPCISSNNHSKERETLNSESEASKVEMSPATMDNNVNEWHKVLKKNKLAAVSTVGDLLASGYWISGCSESQLQLNMYQEMNPTESLAPDEPVPKSGSSEMNEQAKDDHESPGEDAAVRKSVLTEISADNSPPAVWLNDPKTPVAAKSRDHGLYMEERGLENVSPASTDSGTSQNSDLTGSYPSQPVTPDTNSTDCNKTSRDENLRADAKASKRRSKANKSTLPPIKPSRWPAGEGSGASFSIRNFMAKKDPSAVHTNLASALKAAPQFKIPQSPGFANVGHGSSRFAKLPAVAEQLRAYQNPSTSELLELRKNFIQADADLNQIRPERSLAAALMAKPVRVKKLSADKSGKRRVYNRSKLLEVGKKIVPNPKNPSGESPHSPPVLLPLDEKTLQKLVNLSKPFNALETLGRSFTPMNNKNEYQHMVVTHCL